MTLYFLFRAQLNSVIVVSAVQVKNQIRPLTSLRFFAALGVLLTHLHLLKAGGALGVQFFFVLSGFILAHQYRHLFVAGVERSAMLYFICLRLGRLYPVYFVTFLLSSTMWCGSPWPLTTFETARSLLMIQSYWPTGERVFAVNGPSWSVSDEMFFYLLFPFIAYGLIWLGVGRSLRLAVLAGTTIFLPMIFIRLWTMPTFGLGWWLLYISPFIRIFDFVFGVIVGLAFERFCKLTRPWDRRKSTAFEIAVVFLFAGVVLKGVPAPEFANGDFWYIPVMALVILCFASSTGVLASVLNSSLLVYLGEISYSIYMTHVIVIEWASRFLSAQFFGSSDNVSIIMAQFGIIVFVLCLSDVLFRWVETPARNYARQYARERFGIY